MKRLILTLSGACLWIAWLVVFMVKPVFAIGAIFWIVFLNPVNWALTATIMAQTILIHR